MDTAETADVPTIGLDLSYLRLQAGGAMNYAASMLRTMPGAVAERAAAVVPRSAMAEIEVPAGLRVLEVDDPFKGRLQARTAMQDSSYEVIHWTGNYMLPVRGRRSVVTIHDFMTDHYREQGFAFNRARLLQGRLVDWSVRRADVVIAHDPLHQQFAQDRRPRGQVVVAPLGPGPWVAQRSEALPEAIGGRPYVLVLGTDLPHKRIGELARRFLDSAACRELSLVHTGAPLDVQDDRVVEAGRVEPPVLARLMEEAVALAMPSSYEGFGMPVLEAAVFGTPVVTTPGCPSAHAAAEFSTVHVTDQVGDFPALLAALAAEPRTRRRPPERAEIYRTCWRRYHEGHLSAARLAVG